MRPVQNIQVIDMTEKMTPAQRANAWQKKNARRFVLSVNTITESDIIDCLEKQPSMQGYIKSLIRRDIESKQE